mmetsp:Transcript_20761/g.45666  ORF Transcript_20761/g.45666 Transcript_20761/m.45666 type:complete len:926 (+) Transcript_20761:35-2812(+)
MTVRLSPEAVDHDMDGKALQLRVASFQGAMTPCNRNVSADSMLEGPISFSQEPPTLRRCVTAPGSLQDRKHRGRVGAIGKHGILLDEPGEGWVPLEVELRADPEERAFLHEHVKQHPVCTLLNERDIESLVDNMEQFAFRAGEVVARSGDVEHHFCVIFSGTLQVTNESMEVLRTMEKGDSFGGSALLYGCSNAATISAVEESRVFGIDGKTFREVLTADEAKRYEENFHFLDSIGLFEDLAAEQKRRVGELAPFTKVHEAGECIITEGLPITEMSVVRSGRLEVFSGGTKVNELSPGDSFGKGAVLYDRQCSRVSVVCATRCSLVCVDVVKMKAVLGKNLAAALESSYIVKCLEGANFLGQFTLMQRRQIVKAMEIREFKPFQSIDERFEYLVVVNGEMLKQDDSPTPTLLSRGQVVESVPVDLQRKRTSRRMRTVSLSTHDFATSQVRAGTTGVRIATLTKGRLINVLQEMGICGGTEENLDHARRMILANKVPLFSQLPKEHCEIIVQSLLLVQLKRSAVVFEQGFDANDFWIVAKGEVEEAVDGQVVRTIGRFGHFGERSLLLSETRRSTVRVLSAEAELWQLERDTFESIITETTRDMLLQRIQLRDTPVELHDLQHIRIIGSGGFGTVRLVEHRHAPLKYALKRVRLQRVKVHELVERECALLAEMDHPLILQLVKVFAAEGSIYILTELVPGGELLNALDRIGRPLNHREAQFYTGSLVLVLDFLHDRGIVFRDLKPENVMLDATGYIKLIDFGTAKKLEHSEGRTFTLIGSFHFMAPEIPRGHGYGTEVDIWSLGVMLFEFVCGTLPFGNGLTDPTGVEICRLVRTSNLVFPDWYGDASGKHLMRMMLRKEPDRRLGSGIEGFQDLKSHAFFKVDSHNSLFDKIFARTLEPPVVPYGPTFLSDGEAAEGLSDGDVFG